MRQMSAEMHQFSSVSSRSPHAWGDREMHRDTPRLSRCQPRCTEIRRGSPHRNGGKLRCGSGLDGGVQAAGSTVALCANPNEGCARTGGLTFQNTFILMVQLRLKFGGIDVAQIGGDGMPLWSDQKQGGVDARAV